ncbi:MAG: DUF2279 domain-containing protein [Melioribacteraceae bacterium]|nr:DUF2279 domain-containing protein [Melioribacteraceae bacterium]
MKQIQFNIKLVIICLLLISIRTLNAQPQSLAVMRNHSNIADEKSINWVKAGVAGSVIMAANIGLWIHYNNNWYTDSQSKFHFKDDWYDYNLNMDKVGHVFTGMFLTQNYYKLLRGGNFSHYQSIWISSGLTFAQLFQIELFDAFDKKYGASWGDIGSNTLGILCGVLQLNYRSANMINLKLSHDINHISFSSDVHDEVITDYSKRTFWLTFHYDELLPESIRNIHPDWLGIALGYGTSEVFKDGRYNMDSKGKGLGKQNFYLALDIDLNRLFKPEPETFFWHLFDFIGYIHIPMPTIELTPKMKFHALYF